MKVHNAMDQRRLTADLKKVLNPLEPLWEQIPPLKMGHRFNQYHTTFGTYTALIDYDFPIFSCRWTSDGVQVVESFVRGQVSVPAY